MTVIRQSTRFGSDFDTNETVLRCAEEQQAKVMDWFGEYSLPEEGHGFPIGTMLVWNKVKW